MIVYAPHITNRIQYIFDLILKDLLGLEYTFTTNSEEFEATTGPKLNYSFGPFAGEMWIEPFGLLEESEIKIHTFEVTVWKGQKIFCMIDECCALPFDIFSASFFLVSRYEEYLDEETDHLERYKPENSLAFKNNFLDTPVINKWAQLLLLRIKEMYPELKTHKPAKRFEFISTIDIDNAFAFKHKNLFRSAGALAKNILDSDFSEARKRIKTWLNISKDPYDTYDYLTNIHTMYCLRPVYFVLGGSYGKYDKNIYSRSRSFIKLVQHLSERGDIGIHPSFASNDNIEWVLEEKIHLEKITGLEITKSRQHYIKLKIPDTYQNLIKIGVQEDYSMGYATQTGFRAGICHPFYFFDLEADTITNLKIYPFPIMDATLNMYLKYSPREAREVMLATISNIKELNGTFVSLWHNESLSEYRNWKGWLPLFEEMINYAGN